MRRLARWWRALWPSRTIRPTREGWWFLLTTLGMGFAAVNTGNNLLYLLLSMLLGTIVVSGILSEQTIRRVKVFPATPLEIFAGSPAAVGCVLLNGKRLLPSYSLTLEVPSDNAAAPRAFYVSKLEPGQERLHSWEETFPRRGRHRRRPLRLMTGFPFGLFVKATAPILVDELLVFPAVRPFSLADLRNLGGSGAERVARPGPGTDLYNLREYRWGDDPRLIHWKSTAKSGAVMVREPEAEAALKMRVVLEGPPPDADLERLEADISLAASLTSHLLGQGSRVELVGPGLFVPLGEGPAHRRRMLEALALWDPFAPEGARRGFGRDASLSEIRIPLGARAPAPRPPGARRVL